VSLLFWGQGAKFQNGFGDVSIKVAHYKKNFKTFVFWDAPQSIKLINLNHNKYPLWNVMKAWAKNWWWPKLGILGTTVVMLWTWLPQRLIVFTSIEIWQVWVTRLEFGPLSQTFLTMRLSSSIYANPNWNHRGKVTSTKAICFEMTARWC